jgi:hypothetical protein
MLTGTQVSQSGAEAKHCTGPSTGPSRRFSKHLKDFHKSHPVNSSSSFILAENVSSRAQFGLARARHYEFARMPAGPGLMDLAHTSHFAIFPQPPSKISACSHSIVKALSRDFQRGCTKSCHSPVKTMHPIAFKADAGGCFSLTMKSRAGKNIIVL